MVDRIVNIAATNIGIGIKNVTFNEPQSGPFSGQPDHARRADDRGHGADGGRVLSWLLQSQDRLGQGRARSRVVLFLTIDKAKFRKDGRARGLAGNSRREVTPTNMWWYRAEAKISGAIVAEAELGAMIAED